jgi:tripartite-type tricarboxylate transporter receptor subunit TctC
MFDRNFGRLAVAGTALVAVCSTALAQGDPAAGYPKQPIKLVIGFAPGGGNDIMGRVVAQKLSERMGQPSVVENKPGAGGIIAAEAVARAAPDGYTLLVAPIGTLVGNPAVFSKLPYDAEKSFAPIGMIADFPLYMTIGADHPAKTVQELVAWSKANPAKANYASTSPLFQVSMEQFKQRTGSNFEHIPFKSSGEMLTAIMTGQVTVALLDPPPLMGQIKSGKVRVLASTGAKRSAELPEVPTLQEAGVNGMVVDAFTALMAPAGTPPTVVARLNQELNALLKLPDVAERFKQLAVNPIGGTPEGVSAVLAREIPIWKDVAKKANIKLD